MSICSIDKSIFNVHWRMTVTTNEQLNEAMADLAALDSPRRRVETITFSICVPKSLAEAFKTACVENAESHPAVLRRMMAEYISAILVQQEQEARSTLKIL
jgi:hypothetical protein